MEIKFIGAAQTVTGSMHLIKTNDSTFLLDCGLFQGKRKLAYELNKTFEFFNPADIDFVILSHAHIDHAGNIPTLYKLGFRGSIYTTFASRDLCSVMLADSAHIQVKDVEYVNKKRAAKGQKLFEPLYTNLEVKEVLKQFVGLNYHREFEVAPNINLTFFDAGHILGSSIIYLSINENGRIINLGFSGDLGRPNLPILKDPEKIPDIDLFICESTYGGRFHDKPQNAEDKLAEVIRTAIKRKAKIITPAFSVGRTQELVYALNRIFDKGKTDPIPVYVDSPLSVDITNVFRIHSECFDNETAQFIFDKKDPFGFSRLNYISSVEESKSLNEKPGPMMIISSSGMCEVGRILHHLSNNIEDPNNIILIVGYSAINTLGRKLVEKEPIVKIFGDEYNVKAEIIVMNSFSAHADAIELIDYCNLLDKDRIQKTFLVHGDFDQQEKFKQRLESNGFQNVFIPEKGETFTF